MSRPSVQRLTLDSDLRAGFERMWAQRRAEASEGRGATGPERVEEALRHPDVLVFVATECGPAQSRERTSGPGRTHSVTLVGYAIASRSPAAALTGSNLLSIDDVYVSHDRRGQGVGTTLLLHIAQYAERAGLQQVGCTVPASARDTNRAMARLGFTAVATRRAAGTGALLTKLSGRALPNSRALVNRRRLLRARHGL